MRGRRKFLFATRNDLEPGIRAFEAKRSVKYMETGLFETFPTEVYSSLLEVPDLGIAKYGQAPLEACYLVLDASTEVRIREVPQRRGGVRYALDAVANPKSINFRPGGMYQDRCLIMGEITTMPDDPTSIELYRLFVREVTKGFVQVQECRIGPEAFRLLESGMRLTQDVRAPTEYDVHL